MAPVLRVGLTPGRGELQSFSAWLRAQVPPDCTATLRVLHGPAEEVRPSGGSVRLQADISADVEQLESEGLRAEMLRRPRYDRQRQI